MNLSSLPNELIYAIVENCKADENSQPTEKLATLYSLARTNPWFWRLLEKPLYDYDWTAFGSKALLWAIGTNNLQTARTSLSSTSATKDSKEFVSFLYQAATRGSPEMVQLLLSCNPDVPSSLYIYYDTVLTQSVYRESTDIMQLLLQRSEVFRKINKQSNSPFSPLYHALGHGNADAIRLLIRYGADITMDNGLILIRASEFGGVELMSAILEHVPTSDEEFNSRVRAHIQRCIIFATKHGSPETVSLLLSHGADINARGDYDKTPLLVAMSPTCTRDNVAEFLFQNGASLDVRDAFGRTPLHCAAGAGLTDILERLIDPAVNPQGPDILREHYMALVKRTAKWGHATTMELLFEQGREYLKPNGLYPALFEAITNGHGPVALQLLSCGAVHTAPPGTFSGFRRGKTLLYVAATHNDLPLVRGLLAQGADPNARAPKVREQYRRIPTTALQVAISNGYWEMAELLLEHDATVIRDKWGGETDLMRAVKCGGLKIVELLITKSDCKAVWDEHCLQVAIARGDIEMVSLLLKYGADATGKLHLRGKRKRPSTREGMPLTGYAIFKGFTNIADVLRQSI